MADQPLAGRVAAVTGASSGIGAATATALSRAGATVALAARRRDRLEELAQRLEGPSSVHEVDLADEQQARSFIEAAHAEHGGLHVLVNNAGVMLLGAVNGADTADWRRMLDVNLWGLLVCTHAALPLIAQSGGGDIVNVSSVAGRRADAGAAVYNMTKFGVHAFSEALRQEALHVGVRVTVVAPGLRRHRAPGPQHRPGGAPGDGRARASRSARCCSPRTSPTRSLYAVTRPPHVCLNEVVVRPTRQAR